MNRELVKNGFTPKEIISATVVTLACAYLAFAHILPKIDAYVIPNITEKVSFIVWSRFGAAVISSVAGGSAAWVTKRFRKK